MHIFHRWGDWQPLYKVNDKPLRLRWEKKKCPCGKYKIRSSK